MKKLKFVKLSTENRVTVYDATGQNYLYIIRFDRVTGMHSSFATSLYSSNPNRMIDAVCVGDSFSSFEEAHKACIQHMKTQ